MTPQARAIARTIDLTAGIAALLLVIGLPAMYFTLSYEYMRGSLETRAEVNARYVEKLVLSNPDMWTYEQVRLGELLQRRSSKGGPEARRILDIADRVVAESADPLAPPILTRRHPIFDAGVRVAEIEVAESLRPLLLRAVVALAGALLIAAVVFAILRIVPMRAIQHAYQSLEESENRYRQAQKMEAVGRLAGGVAHDFNNILTVILSYASELAEDLTGAQREYAREIERAGQRATALTRQLLSFSRKQVLRPQVLRVNDVISNMGSMMSRLIGEDVELSLAAAEDVGCIHMDPAQVEQVLVNLVVNARDAMPDGGKLTIEARNADVTAADEGDPGALAPGPYVVLRVSDTGTGMDEATLSRLFEPFFTTKPKGKGTGLGLAMVFGAIEQSGGHIEVASQPGVGTTFTLHLPRVAAPAPPADDAPRATRRTGGHERVLVVEDEPQVRASIRLFLTAEGFSVVEAASGDEGLAVFQGDADGIDLVLTDLVMPGMSGVALGRAIHARCSVPVVYMSGYSDEVFSGKEKLPPERFLQKPFDRATLLDRVRAALPAPARSPIEARPSAS